MGITRKLLARGIAEHKADCSDWLRLLLDWPARTGHHSLLGLQPALHAAKRPEGFCLRHRGGLTQRKSWWRCKTPRKKQDHDQHQHLGRGMHAGLLAKLYIPASSVRWQIRNSCEPLHVDLSRGGSRWHLSAACRTERRAEFATFLPILPSASRA